MLPIAAAVRPLRRMIENKAAEAVWFIKEREQSDYTMEKPK